MAATAAPVDLLVLLDQSGSMADPVAGGTKWQAVSAALADFAQTSTQPGLRMGLAYFAVAGASGDSCAVADYATELVPHTSTNPFGSDHMREELRMLRDAVLARGAPATHVLAEGLRVLEDSDLRAALPALSVPSLWIAGRRDRLVNPQAMRTSADIAPDARFVQVEHAGHAPFLTHADEVAGALLGFLAEQGA